MNLTLDAEQVRVQASRLDYGTITFTDASGSTVTLTGAMSGTPLVDRLLDAVGDEDPELLAAVDGCCPFVGACVDTCREASADTTPEPDWEQISEDRADASGCRITR